MMTIGDLVNNILMEIYRI